MRSPEEKGYLLEHPELFLVTYFSHRLRPLKDFHLRLIETATTQVRGLILYPATHGKTTLVSELLPIWEVCRDPNTLIAIIQKNDTAAKSVMRSIHAEMLGNHELIRDFGPFRDEDGEKAWALERIEVAKRTRRHSSATIAAFGAGARTALGYRTKWTIADDIVETKNSATEEQRAKMREWWDLAPETMPEEQDDRITVAGTLFHPADLYHDLRELRYPDTGELVYYEQREDAIVDEEERETLWPERWPWRRLMALKARMGTLEFNKRMRNVAVDPSKMVFKEEYIKGGYSSVTKQTYPGCLDRGYVVGDYDETWRRGSGFDPAVGIGRSAKFCAHLVLAEGSCAKHERCFWVIDLTRDQMTTPKQVNLILATHEEYDLLTSVIEANSYQAGLAQSVEEKASERGLAMHIEPHYTGRVNKPDPEIGVEAMSPWFENGMVHIPWGDETSRRKMQKFVDELIEYPGVTTDTVMACWFIWKKLKETRPRFKAHNRLTDGKRPYAGRVAGRSVPNPFYQREEVAGGDRA